MTNRSSIGEVYDTMIRDSTTKPPFLNMRKQMDKDLRDNISSIIIEATAAVKPYVLNDKQITDIYINVQFEWEIIETVCRDIIVYFKAEKYIDDLFIKWIELASDLEEYEIAENLNKIKAIIDKKRCLKNNI
jgi:hypothetical protein